MTHGALAAVLLLILVATGVRRTSGQYRLLVVRRGVINRLDGPGFSYVVPFLERAIRVDLEEVAPDWRGAAAEELHYRTILYIGRPFPDPADWPSDVSRIARGVRRAAAYLVLFTVSLGSGLIVSTVCLFVLRWLGGSPPASLSEFYSERLPPESVALMILGLSVGSILGWFACVSFIQQIGLVPDRIVRELLYGPQVGPSRGGGPP